MQPPQEPSASQPPDTVRGDDAAKQKCFVCGKEIADGAWFCRVPHGAKRIVLCSPSCALRYFDTLHPTTNGYEQDYPAEEHRRHFFVDGKGPFV